MNGDEILGVLREIRDEAKKTNVRLESLEGRVGQTNARLESLEGRVGQTNDRLESLEGRVGQTNDRLESLDGRVEQTNLGLRSLEGRVEFLERHVTKGFADMSESIGALARAQADAELRIATEVVSLANVTRELRDVIASKLSDHEKRLKAIEKRNGSKKR